MALIACPECKGNVSNLASACPHCGRPMEVSIPGDDACYAVVLLNGGPFHDETVVCLSRVDNLSRDEAWTILRSAPAVIKRDLSRKTAGEYASALSKYCEVKVVLNEETGSIEEALNADDAILPPRHERPRLPLTFGETLLAAFLGCTLFALLTILWSVITQGGF